MVNQFLSLDIFFGVYLSFQKNQLVRFHRQGWLIVGFIALHQDDMGIYGHIWASFCQLWGKIIEHPYFGSIVFPMLNLYNLLVTLRCHQHAGESIDVDFPSHF